MNKRSLISSLAAVAAVVTMASPAYGQQDPTPRYGQWRMDQEAPAPASNIMTYEPYGSGGMKVTVASVNARGQGSEWGYVTMFDGVFRPVTGQDGSETAVEFVNERTTRIYNKRNGVVTQVIINTLSEDGKRIDNEYVRLDQDGKITGVSHAVYRRIE